MSREVRVLDPPQRARDKQGSRERDADRLRRGEVSREQLASENGWFSSLDLSSFEIVAIGGRPLVR